jgi:hypothetical protein
MTKWFLFCTLSFVLFVNQSYAQENWGGGTDESPLNLGFVFQAMSSNYAVVKKSSWRDPFIDNVTGQMVKPPLYSITSPVTPGFGVGFVTNVKLGEHFDLRLSPGYVFSDHTLKYEYAHPDDAVTRTVPFSIVSVPLAIRVKSDRKRNFRAYFATGARYSLDLLSEDKINGDKTKPLAEKAVKNQKGILWYEAAIGFQIYFEYFKLSPEIKFSHTLNSTLRSEEHPYSSPLEKLFIQDIQVSIYLE